MRKITQFILTALVLVISSPILATSQCPPGAKCEVPIEAKVTFLAMAEALHEPCAQLDSDNIDKYQEAKQLLNDKFGEDARAHEKYDEALSYYQELTSTMSGKTLKRECNGFMNQVLKELKALEN